MNEEECKTSLTCIETEMLRLRPQSYPVIYKMNRIPPDSPR